MTKENNSQEAAKLFSVNQEFLKKIVDTLQTHLNCEKKEVFSLNLNVKSFVPIINFDLKETKFNLDSPSGFMYVESKTNPNINFVFKQEKGEFFISSKEEIKKVDTQLNEQTNNLKQLTSDIHPDNLKLMRQLMNTLKSWTHLSQEEEKLLSIQKAQKLSQSLDKSIAFINTLSKEEKEKFEGMKQLSQQEVFKPYLVNVLMQEGYSIKQDIVVLSSFTPIKNSDETITGYFHLIDNTQQYLIKKTNDGLHLVGIKNVQDEMIKLNDEKSPYHHELQKLISNHQKVNDKFNESLTDAEKERNSQIWSKLKSSKMVAKANYSSQVSLVQSSYYLAKNNKLDEMKGFVQIHSGVENDIGEIPFEEFKKRVNEFASEGSKPMIGLKDLINANAEKSFLESKIKAFRKPQEENLANKKKI